MGRMIVQVLKLHSPASLCCQPPPPTPTPQDEVSITVVDGLDKVLSTFNESISRYAGKLLKREGAVLKLGTM